MKLSGRAGRDQYAKRFLVGNSQIVQYVNFLESKQGGGGGWLESLQNGFSSPPHISLEIFSNYLFLKNQKLYIKIKRTPNSIVLK